MSNDPRAQAELALKHAQRATKQGDLRAAERWSKTAERMAQAAEKLAGAPQVMTAEDEEAIRAEIRGRIRRLAEAEHDLTAWRQEYADHQAALAAAARDGGPAPAPLRPCPGGPDYLERIARGEA